MLERIIENWLTSVNEKTFQIPFCQLLIAEGYKEVHMSRHGSFEEGKDVLAIDPDGIPCAFQLKSSNGKKIKQKEWAKYSDQIVRLVETPIIHPSIKTQKGRKVFFVTNGELDEEVRIEITHRNQEWKSRGYPELTPIVLGELIPRLTNIHTSAWPIHLTSEKRFLELYLADGSGCLEKDKFAFFIKEILLDIGKKTKIESQRCLANASLFACYALFPYIKTENHIAIIEGWIIFLATLVAFVEKNKLAKKYWKNLEIIVEEIIEAELDALWIEVKNRSNFVEGNPLVDSYFIKGRLTWILSYISSFILMQRNRIDKKSLDDEFSDFLLKNRDSLFLWGEGATPQLLAIFWALEFLGYSIPAISILVSIFIKIIKLNKNQKDGIPDPYHSFGEVVIDSLNLSDKKKNEIYKNRTYSLTSIIYLLVRRNYRKVIEEYWKEITYLNFISFEPNNVWQYCLWHCEDGVFREIVPETPQSWADIVKEANMININRIPKYFADNPVILLLFIIVYPHRLHPNTIKFLDDSFRVKFK